MDFFSGKTILVTGGCGSIGSEIVRLILAHRPRAIRVYDNHEAGHFAMEQRMPHPDIRHLLGDVRDAERLNRAMEGVDMVFHAAALKHVPLCEYNPYEAVFTNVIGTKNVVEAAVRQGVRRMVSISTDKAVNPINTMGATKLLSEKVVVNAPLGDNDGMFSCVRFGNVLGSVGSVVPIFQRQISQGGPVTLTTLDMTRFFMTISDAVRLVLQAARDMKGRETFILKMDVVKIQDLAEVMIRELAPKYGYRPEDISLTYIGKRPGEKTHELLFTEEEAPYIQETDTMLVLRNSPFDESRKENPDWQQVLQRNQGKVVGQAEIQEYLKYHQLI